MATKIIALDSGHALKTPGKQTPDGIKEWTLNDKVRDYVVDYLKDYDVKFVFPDNNEGSKDESLSSRKSMYLNKDVDAAVSIHHNAFTGKWGSANGVEIYVDKNNTSADMKLAKAIYKNLPKYTGLKSRGIKKANWTVINQNKIPTVLVEGGFMDNRGDYAVITSAKGQKAYAKAVAEGLIEFLGLKKKKVTTTVKKEPAEKKETFKSYTVKVTAKTLNIRKSASASSEVVGVITDDEKLIKKNPDYYFKKTEYTIIGEKMNGKTKWLQLKSGIGYISANYTEKA